MAAAYNRTVTGAPSWAPSTRASRGVDAYHVQFANEKLRSGVTFANIAKMLGVNEFDLREAVDGPLTEGPPKREAATARAAVPARKAKPAAPAPVRRMSHTELALAMMADPKRAGGLTTAELARRTGALIQSAAQTMNRLGERKLARAVCVARGPVPRHYVWQLTDEGRALAQRQAKARGDV